MCGDAAHVARLSGIFELSVRTEGIKVKGGESCQFMLSAGPIRDRSLFRE